MKKNNKELKIKIPIPDFLFIDKCPYLIGLYFLRHINGSGELTDENNEKLAKIF